MILPKGNGDYWGIGLLELSWKIIELIINQRIASKVTFHNALHGFQANRGTGIACIEAKLLHPLSEMVQTTLHFIFLDFWKVYDTVDREQLLEILEGYGVGPNVLGLLKLYWDHQPCVVKCMKYHGETFIPYCGATQGCVVFPTFFNILVDAVVRKWWVDVMNIMTTSTQDYKVTTLVVCPHYFMPTTARLGPSTKNDYRMLHSIPVICSGITPA